MYPRQYRKFAPICLAALGFVTGAAAHAAECPDCEAWNLPQEPFRIHGDTYYVGVQGLSAILIASPEGHVLIDGALSESAWLIASNIRALRFRIEDVRLILNSHVHFDHAGGIAELQRLSGAEVVASPWSEGVLREGGIGVGDPQGAIGLPVEPVASTRVIRDGETLRVGPVALTAHFTLGHTPGGTSWTWRSCDEDVCLDIVYADSLTPVSAGDFQFTRNADYPDALADFGSSFAVLESISCDIFLAPHPGFADLLPKYERFLDNPETSPFVDPDGCHNYVVSMRDWLGRRIAEEHTVRENQN